MFDFLLKIQIEGKEFSAAANDWIKKIADIQVHLFNELYDGVAFELAEEAQKVIKRNLYNANTWTGESVTPLKQSTIDKKGHHKPFFDTGELYNSILTQKLPNGAEVFVADGRALIAGYLINGTTNMPERDFFGIMSERVEVILMQILNYRYNTIERMAA